MRTREEQIAAIEEFCGTLGISNDSPDAETIEQWLGAQIIRFNHLTERLSERGASRRARQHFRKLKL